MDRDGITISVQVKDILDTYSKEMKEEVDGVLKEVSKEAVAQLKTTSPKSGASGKHYAGGWRAKREKKGQSYIIHNALKPGLTHLLEYGHAKVNGGKTKAIPHIKPVEEWANQEVVSRIKEVLQR